MHTKRKQTFSHAEIVSMHKKCKFENILSMKICLYILEQLHNIWPGGHRFYTLGDVY